MWWPMHLVAANEHDEPAHYAEHRGGRKARGLSL